MILKDEIKTIVRRVLNREMWPDYATNQILAVIAPELEKAKKWDRIIQVTSTDRCTICIIGNKCDEPKEWEGFPCEILRHIVNALEGEEKKDDRYSHTL